MIRRLVPEERLLEWNVEDGWKPLCEFLGKEVPETPFPRTNDKDGFAKRVGTDTESLGRNALMNMASVVLSFLAFVAFVFFR